MREAVRPVLVLGYGNPGRLDDGLGPALAAAIEARHLPGVTVDADYQLTVEDAAVVAEHHIVIFADADLAGPEPFWFRRIEPAAEWSFSTHAVEPTSVLGLAADLFGARTDGFLLGIRGYDFDAFGERLSPRAQSNLAAAAAFLEQCLRDGHFPDSARGEISESAAQSAPNCGDTPCKTEST
jgi:hydrogenase maturation protease